MSDLPLVHESTITLDDGTTMTTTLRADGPISNEDKAFIHRFLPLGAESMLNVTEESNNGTL